MLGDRNNIRAGDLSNSDTIVSLISGIKIDMVRSNTSSDSNLKVLSFSQTLSSEVSRVETIYRQSADDMIPIYSRTLLTEW